MSDVKSDAPAVKVTGGKIDGLDEALAEAKAMGLKEGRAEGYAEGRKDAAAIIKHEAATGRETFAAKLAGDATFTVDKAVDFMADTPQANNGANSLDNLMKGRESKVEAGEGDADPNAARAAELKAAASGINSIRRF